MNIFKRILILTVLCFSTNGFTAIGCKPGMNSCPGPKAPQLPGGGGHYPSNNDYQAIGYFELPSPECTPADREKAVVGAKARALSDARRVLGTEEINQITEFRLDQRCAQGMYANSSKGFSWIIQAFAKYSLK